MAAGGLKLLAEDSDGLAVIAGAVQDALVKPDGIRFDRTSRTFGMELNRFQWERAGRRPPYFRARSILAFAGVENARSRNVTKEVDAVLSLLDLSFAPATQPPGGVVTLTFAGDTQIRLDVECLDVTLADIGPVWPTGRKPDHDRRR